MYRKRGQGRDPGEGPGIEDWGEGIVESGLLDYPVRAYRALAGRSSGPD